MPKEFILSPDIITDIFRKATNRDVIVLNNEIISRIRGNFFKFSSIDSSHNEKNENEPQILSMKFLNNLLPIGIPPQKLKLKTGAIAILLRN